jgi:hypothetical protein
VYELPAPTELEFRDGKRLVPEYLAAIMHGLETFRMTYEEAVVAANKRMQADFINARGDAVIKAHFERNR